MNRSQFEKLWFTGNVRIQIDEMKAAKIVWRGYLGKGKKAFQILWILVSATLAGIGIWIGSKMEFDLSPTVIGTSWWGVVLLALSSGIPFLMKASAAQAAKNRIIRDPEFYSLAQEKEVFSLEEYN